MTRPFRFGVIADTNDTDRERLTDLGHRAADAGFDIILATDHFGQLAPLQVLQTVAEVSPLRIGTLVLNNDMRHPAVLAHELAALDQMSAGRLEIGLGAGWSKWEYDDVSMAFDRPGRRVDRLQASIDIVKQALSAGEVEQTGGPYGDVRMAGVPKSLQRPHPPILIGGGGQRLLSLAAREAQIVAIDPRALPEGGQRTGEAAPSVVDEKIGYIRDAAGDRIDELEINLIVFELDPAYRGQGRPNVNAPQLSDDEIVESPYYLLGDVEAVTDAIHARRERWGISYYAVNERNLDFAAPLARRVAGT
jgi:probable F420-dependent oxidoreductase